eukprot:TRINITY_DN19579_c0_g1_i1.p2 TRINITY_DN19579_c0_g1~~TRINITY_DN19579_c0_g1_i1.p2  ORF type:complete len:174 (-),score=27.88 TRINITY_DN19579_c0_g1_i1:5-526(-)
MLVLIVRQVSAVACSTLPRVQSPNGMMWRSPWEAAAQNSSNPNWFSRDQALGLMAALTNIKQQQEFYDHWLAYIVAHKGYMCPKEWDCTLYLPFWCTFMKVAHFAGLQPPPADLMVPRVGPEVCSKDHLLVLTSVSVNKQGSALHLAAVDVYLRRMILDWDSTMHAAADLLHA